MVSIMYVFLTVNCHAKIVGRSKWKKSMCKKCILNRYPALIFMPMHCIFKREGVVWGDKQKGGGRTFSGTFLFINDINI